MTKIFKLEMEFYLDFFALLFDRFPFLFLSLKKIQKSLNELKSHKDQDLI
jgi:hypothetical protein